MKALFKVIRKNKYNIVHIQQNSASMAMDMLICKMCGVKAIIGHSHNTRCNVLWQHYLLKPFVNLLCDYRFACSEAAGKWVFGNRQDITVWNNAINADEYAFDESVRVAYRAQFELEDKFVVGFVGRLHEQKNLFKAMSVFSEVKKQNKNAAFVLVGDGEQRKELEQFAHDYGFLDSVHFLGRRDDVVKLMSMFDVFLFPSIYEGLGLVVIEAQASGLRCIVSNQVPAPNLTGNVEYLPLDLPDEEWAKKLLENPPIDRISATEQIKTGNYDILLEAVKLQNFYLGLQKYD